MHTLSAKTRRKLTKEEKDARAREVVAKYLAGRVKPKPKPRKPKWNPVGKPKFKPLASPLAETCDWTPISLPWPLDREIWRAVDGFPGYDVSSSGRVRTWKGPDCTDLYEPMVMSPTRTEGGYLRVKLVNEKRQKKNVSIHRLVLLAFVGESDYWFIDQCRHIDGNAADSNVNNLCWGTARDNGMDKRRHNRMRREEALAAAPVF